MPNFFWKGIDFTGNTLSGYRIAVDVADLSDQLLSEKIALLSAKQQSRYWNLLSGFVVFKRPSAYEFVTFFESLSVLIEGGVELFAALQTINTQDRNQKIKNVVELIKNDIEQGKLLSIALNNQSKIFDAFIIQMVRVGEDSDTLGPVLSQLSEYLKKRYELRQNLLNSAAVPMFTLFFALAIIFIIFVCVIPQFQSFFNSLGKAVPNSTQRLIAVSNFLRSVNLFWTLFIIMGLLLGAFMFLGKEKIKRARDFVLFYSPFVSKVVVLSGLANFLQSLSLLLKSGIPLKDSVLIASAAVENIYLKEHLKSIADKVSLGLSVAESLSCLQGFYQCDMLISLIKVGEKVGDLNAAIDKATPFFSNELKGFTNLMTAFLQPLLLVVIGFIVGIVVWIIYLPIINLAYSVG